MSQASHPKAAATRLAEAARQVAAVHGDARAQTVAYALLLRRLNPEFVLDCLLDGFGCRDSLLRIETALDSIDLDGLLSNYESAGRDPAIYFYEDFARAYDPASARGRGTLYTPPEVVSCIVRAADWVLRESFGLRLSDALVVDPCCGVGTFLRHIERQTAHRPRMMGLELMPAPCAIARCLLERSQIVEADWLSDSAIEAGSRPLVIIGNPPYSGHSYNAGSIADLMADYREGLAERNPKWLQDDYVKFIRMAQHRVECAGSGVVAFVTNHSYLFNPTFRAMRRSLARTFDEILVLDLGGNAKRLQDENVFPIQMGVAISLFVKTSFSPACRIRHASLFGTKDEKLKALADLDPGTMRWREVTPAEPFAVFIPQDNSLREEFYGFTSLFDIFAQHTMGFVTSRDRFAIGFTKDEVLSRVGSEYADEVVEVLYRPFDRRWACCSRNAMERPRLPFMTNLMRDNVSLAVGRAGQVTGSSEWDVVFATDRPADLNLFRRGGAKLFPRYVYAGDERVSNMLCDYDHDSLFGYIYAVLHSAAYRSRYAEFLAIDYPRIPMPPDDRTIAELVNLGWRLIDTHLMRLGPHSTPPASEERITIGGYEEPAKCLKDRAGVDDAQQVSLLHTAVAKTLDLRSQIDRVVAQHPPWTRKAAV